jgi:hypothetical protein
MKINLKQRDVGEENTTNEIKNELMKNICENITNEKKWTKNCPMCNIEMVFKTKRTLNDSLKFNTKCRKCISKNFPSPMRYLNYQFSKSHRDKIGKKSTERQLGKKHSNERIKNMISGLVKMPYDEWVNICPKEVRYRKKVHYISRKNCEKNKVENFGEVGYNMDHIFPVKEGFKLNIPEEIMSDISNLRIIKEIDNKKKSSKIIEIPDVIKPYYEKNNKS